MLIEKSTKKKCSSDEAGKSLHGTSWEEERYGRSSRRTLLAAGVRRAVTQGGEHKGKPGRPFPSALTTDRTGASQHFQRALLWPQLHTKGSSKLQPKEEPAQWDQTNCATEKKPWIWSGQNSESWDLSRLRHQDDARRQNLTHTSQWPWLLMVSISSENTQSSRRDSKNSIQEPNLAFKEMYYLRVQGQKKYSSY